ncbi:MAG: hypothetical protein NTX72_04350 [Candidatus Uhrbacteria bacterium]|nr:hypothetical protein [Candidatus Uhrbacteria bacterium]
MKKPYVKKLDTIGDVVVWEVDGEYVRGHMNEEFTNFGQHERFPFIPSREVWIDHECVSGEQAFFTHHLLTERRLMRSGMSYARALAYADRAERSERKKSVVMKRLRSKKITPESLAKIYKKKLATYANGLTVWLVRGELVRDICFIDYTEGGHDYVYPFVPANEVWIDDDLKQSERPFVLLHEVHERRLMSDGMDYHRAHHSASLLEQGCRKRPSSLVARLKKEVALNTLKTK